MAIEEKYGEIIIRLFDIPPEDFDAQYIIRRTSKINDFMGRNREDITHSLSGWLEHFPAEVPEEILKGFNVNPLFMFQTGMLFGYLLKERHIRSK